MSQRQRLFKPKNELVICPECEARLKIEYFSNCAEYTCSECDYKDTIWEELKEKIVRGPSKPKPKTRYHLLGDAQIKKIIKVIKTDIERFVFIGLLYTGLRASEFIHMRKTWINFKRHLIVIPDKQSCNCNKCKTNRIKLSEKDVDSLNDHQKTILEGYWVPKTASSARTIPIVPEARKVLYPFFKKYKTVMKKLPMTQYLNIYLNRLKKRCKIKIFPHCLRGTFATMLAIDGFDAYKITNILGWADINVAMFYINLSGAALTNEVEDKWSPKQI